MGKKYVIELPENTHWIQWIMEGTKDHHPYTDFKQVEDLTPYAAPDLEQVKSVYNAWYKKGLADAWDAARKTENLSEAEKFEIFGEYDMSHIMRRYTASEAIEKLKAYEQEKRFCVGDEFENESGKRYVIIKMDGTEIDRYIDKEGKTYCMIAKYKVIRKTGRHFPEVAEVLEKMRGEQNGKSK